MEGIFSIFKPEGCSSHDIVASLRKIVKDEKIGHAGTLDPLAKGVLVVGIGSNNTKKLGLYLNKEKEYLAIVKLGEESVTDDREGNKKEIAVKKPPSLNEIKKAVSKFKGEIMQVPPAFSAVKVSGVRAYKLARKGKEIDLKARVAKVKDINVLKYDYPLLMLNIKTGPGVYIRAIARDIGRELKTGAYLLELTRTRVGDFSIEDSLTLNQFKKKFKLS